jgi:hypothetical protein
VIVRDEESRGETQKRESAPFIPREELPTQPPEAWARPLDEASCAAEPGGAWVEQAWEEQHARQVPTVRPTRAPKPRRRRPGRGLVLAVLLLSGAAVGYLRFPGECAHALDVTSGHAQTWGGVVQQKLAR